jgi:hypothetical protein
MATTAIHRPHMPEIVQAHELALQKTTNAIPLFSAKQV